MTAARKCVFVLQSSIPSIQVQLDVRWPLSRSQGWTDVQSQHICSWIQAASWVVGAFMKGSGAAVFQLDLPLALFTALLPLPLPYPKAQHPHSTFMDFVLC